MNNVVLAYIEEASNSLIKEQKAEFNNEQEFSDWYDCNLPAIVNRAKELQFHCWIKFVELELIRIPIPGIYSRRVHTNLQQYLMAQICQRVYYRLNQKN